MFLKNKICNKELLDDSNKLFQIVVELFYQGYGCASEIFCSLVCLKYQDLSNFLQINIDVILDIVRFYVTNDGIKLKDLGIVLVLEYSMGKMSYSEAEITLAV